MADQTQLPGKKDVARALLLKGTVFVHLDPRKPDVSVPAWLTDQPQLVLQVGLDMPIPIPDLRVDDRGVYGTLSFNRSPFTCMVPWDAVFAVVGDDGKGMVWPESMPPEIASEVERDARRHGIKTVPPLRPRPRPDRGSLEEVPREEELSRRGHPSLRPAPVPDAARLNSEFDDLRPPADLSERRESRDATGSERTDRSSDSWRPRNQRKGKVKLPPYLRVIK